MFEQVFRFVMVGGGAAATHMAVVIALVEALRAGGGDEPGDAVKLACNLGGFLVAVGVSYFGHRNFTFGSTKSHGRAAPQFLAVALTGFVLNEGMFWALLRFTALSYQLALFLVLGAVAALTFALSRLWVFAR
ncbi:MULTISPECIES: GtrA family protein [Derxia]|uniref:GtrA family protein n=1 Tax=Derxia gummosa DSM 723 TaxID=1121388 RepID=A0A9U5H003_9BURK|nr:MULTISPECIES: GtrA family protein [Derxia]